MSDFATLAELREWLARAPDDLELTFTAARLREILDVEDGLVDLTVDDVAEKLDRTAGTIRRWCGEGKIGGAYRLNGREWRIPPASLREFLDRQAEDTPGAGGEADLSEWRNHFRSEDVA